MRVEVKIKIIPKNFLKIEGKRTFVVAKDRRKRDYQIELVCNQKPSPKASPVSKKGGRSDGCQEEQWRSQEDVGREVMEKSNYIRVIG